ncbi:MAG: hypothetical protein IPH49_01775 [Ignavibacteria bacterium]|nr:hypothetical protein [Ignavibacteria bacterium]
MRTIFVVLVMCCCAMATFAADSLVVGATRPAHKGNLKPVRAELSAMWTFGIDADEFFKDYQLVLGGKASGFNAPMGFSASLSTYQLGNASIGVMAGYYKAVVRENYDYKPLITDTSFAPPQNITQDIALTCIPALLTIDYYPHARQFTGFVGAGIGLGAATFRWTETITESQSIGARLGGERYNETHLVPAVMLRAGVSSDSMMNSAPISAQPSPWKGAICTCPLPPRSLPRPPTHLWQKHLRGCREITRSRRVDFNSV